MVSGVEEGADGKEYRTLANSRERSPTELRAHGTHSGLSTTGFVFFCSFLLVYPVSPLALRSCRKGNIADSFL